MSVMSELSMDIQDMLEEGFAPATIARILEIPVSWVYEASVQETSAEDYLDIADLYSPYETVNS